MYTYNKTSLTLFFDYDFSHCGAVFATSTKGVETKRNIFQKQSISIVYAESLQTHAAEIEVKLYYCRQT